MALTAVLLCLFVALPATVLAEPCANLADDPEYGRLVGEGSSAAIDGDFDTALARFEQAQQVCPYDPTVTFYIARTSQLAGDCTTAIRMYKQAAAQLDMKFVATELTVAMIDQKRAETETFCSTRAFVAIACADAEVELQLGDGAQVACPFEGDLPAGKQTLVASRQGTEPHRLEVDLVAGSKHRFEIPALKAPIAATGTLDVRCPAGFAEVVVASGAYTKTEPCPTRVELAAGDYLVSVPRTEMIEHVILTPGKEVQIVLSAPRGAASEEHGGEADGGARLGWVLVGVGVGVAGIGVGVHFVAASMVDEIDTTMTQVEAQQSQDDAELYNTLGLVGVGLGTAAAVAGLVLVFWDVGAEAAGGTSMQLAPSIGPASLGLSLSGRF